MQSFYSRSTRSLRLIWPVGVVLILATVVPVAAQEFDPAILATVETAYGGISANEGEDRDWPAFHALFLPNARLVNVRGNASDGFEPQSLSVPEWIVSNMTWLEGRGFVEDFELQEIQAYGPIAHVFTTWVTRRERGGEERSHGAATFQLVSTQDGWRVASWIWTGEQEGLPLPGNAL